MRLPLVVFAAFALMGTVAGGQTPAPPDPSVMSAKYREVWNADEQARIDADIERNRKADAVVALDLPVGTEVEIEQLTSDFRFGAHIFNFNQLGRKAWNDAYKAESKGSELIDIVALT